MKHVTKSIARFLTLVALLFTCCLSAQAQRFTAKGVVVDSNGEPVIGAAVALKGNETVGVITDLDGNFSLSVPGPNTVLVGILYSLWWRLTLTSQWLTIDD